MTPNSKRFFIVGGDYEIAKMFTKAGYSQDTQFKDIGKQIVVFTGGSDVTPLLYGERRLSGTYCNLSRDLDEVKLFKLLPPSVPKVGICRGGQFLNVMSGGTLWQDVNNHAVMGGHKMWVVDGPSSQNEIHVTSTHHQMMIPNELGDILACANLSTCKKSDGDVFELTEEQAKKSYDDVEVVWYKHTNSLCFQPHPEYPGVPDCTKYFFELLDKYFHNIEPREPVVHIN